MTRLGDLLARFGLTTRLIVWGSVVAALAWWALDVQQSATIEAMVRTQLTAQLEEEARLDRLRFDANVRAHHTFTALLARHLPVVRHVDGVLARPGEGKPLVHWSEPSWLPPRSLRRGFPLVNWLLILDGAGTVREASHLLPDDGRGQAAPPDIGPRLVILAEEQSHIVTLGGEPFLVSVAAVEGIAGRLVALSRLDTRFMAHALGALTREGHVGALVDGARAVVLASSDPARLAPGAGMASVRRDWLVAGQDFFDYGSSEAVVNFVTLYPQARISAESDRMLAIERTQRTVMALALSALFVVVLLVLAVRLRRMIDHVAGVTGAICGTPSTQFEGGDEMLGLVRQVERLGEEVLSSREALQRETTERIRQLTEHLRVSAENDRLRLLKAVTDLVGVGVIRLTEDGPMAENDAMALFADLCGGLHPFLRAKADGHGEVRLTGTDGGERIFLLSLASEVDPGLLMVEDITERRRAEEAVSSLALFPAQNPNPVLRIAADGTLLHANPASTALQAEWGATVGHPLPEPWRGIVARALAAGRQRQMEVKVGDRVLALTMVPLPGAGYLNIYAGDVTARVAAEAELKAAKDQLELRVIERTRDLMAAKDQAELASRAKTEFLAAVSHELRTPLNAIIGFSEVMAHGLFGPLGNARYRDYAADILASGRHLLDVINDILDVAKIEEGKMTLVLEPVPVDEVVNAALRLVEGRAEAGGVSLDSSVEAAPAMVQGDRRRLLQILVNLLSNAVKFTPRGGRVAVRAWQEAGSLMFTVADTGIGMDDREVSIALQPFRQVDGRLERRYDGTGLGLPLAKAFAELHGGGLVILSRPGKGTTVKVCLPARPVEALAAD